MASGDDDFGVPNSTSHELRNFKRGTIWRDMLKELEIWEEEGLKTLRDPLSNTDTGQMEQDFGAVRFCQGGLDIINRLKNLVDAMIDFRVTYEEAERDG